MDFQYTGWRSHSPDSMYSQYSQSQYQSPFNANVSTSLRRPAPPRVVKPTSRNGSPRHVGRRRTTTNVPVARTRSVLDQQRSNPYPTSTPKRNARPLSWHPNSQMDLNFSNQDYLMNMSYQPYLQPYTFHGTTLANGLVTPMSYPVLNEPQIQELITPLEELSAQEGMGYQTGSYNNYQNWAQTEIPKDQMNTMDHMFPHTQPQQMWQWSHQTSTLDPPTAPSSPSFLPIQGGIEPSKEDEGEELVGMGLYDSPADVQSSSLLFGGGFGEAPKAKSLKLAESFEPPENNSADGEDDDDDDANEEAAEEEEEEEQEESPTADEEELHGQQIPPVQQAPPPNTTSTLAGQSFFFESEHDLPITTYTQINPLAMGGYQHQYQDLGYGLDFSAC